MNPLPWMLGLFLASCAGQGADGVPLPPYTDMRKIERPSSPNNAVAGPAGSGRQAVDLITEPYAVAPQALYPIVKAALSTMPNTYLLAEYADRTQMHFVVRSKVLNFPDIVSIQIETGGREGESLITLYSRSIYGYYDFGANKARLLPLLARIDQAITQAEQPATLKR